MLRYLVAEESPHDFGIPIAFDATLAEICAASSADIESMHQRDHSPVPNPGMVDDLQLDSLSMNH